MPLPAGGRRGPGRGRHQAVARQLQPATAAAGGGARRRPGGAPGQRRRKPGHDRGNRQDRRTIRVSGGADPQRTRFRPLSHSGSAAMNLPIAGQTDGPLMLENIPALQDEVRKLARRHDAVILAHNYQLPEIQDVAHYVGDSLGLSRQAAAAGADTIVFCGVHFMAETASILCPGKRVLIPDADAGCSLADSITAEQLRTWKAAHPGAITVMYVNTTAEVKAETDYCCTASNAVKVGEH